MHNPRLSKIRPKFRILLDSAFATPTSFPRLRKIAKVYHPVHDLKLSPQTEDAEIYQKACEENMSILTISFKDFAKLVKRNKPGIFGIESQLSNADIDTLVSNFLRGKNPLDYIGKATKIPHS